MSSSKTPQKQSGQQLPVKQVGAQTSNDSTSNNSSTGSNSKKNGSSSNNTTPLNQSSVASKANSSKPPSSANLTISVPSSSSSSGVISPRSLTISPPTPPDKHPSNFLGGNLPSSNLPSSTSSPSSSDVHNDSIISSDRSSSVPKVPRTPRVMTNTAPNDPQQSSSKLNSDISRGVREESSEEENAEEERRNDERRRKMAAALLQAPSSSSSPSESDDDASTIDDDDDDEDDDEQSGSSTDGGSGSDTENLTHSDDVSRSGSRRINHPMKKEKTISGSNTTEVANTTESTSKGKKSTRKASDTSSGSSSRKASPPLSRKLKMQTTEEGDESEPIDSSSGQLSPRRNLISANASSSDLYTTDSANRTKSSGNVKFNESDKLPSTGSTAALNIKSAGNSSNSKLKSPPPNSSDSIPSNNTHSTSSSDISTLEPYKPRKARLSMGGAGESEEETDDHVIHSGSNHNLLPLSSKSLSSTTITATSSEGDRKSSSKKTGRPKKSQTEDAGDDGGKHKDTDKKKRRKSKSAKEGESKKKKSSKRSRGSKDDNLDELGSMLAATDPSLLQEWEMQNRASAVDEEESNVSVKLSVPPDSSEVDPSSAHLSAKKKQRKLLRASRALTVGSGDTEAVDQLDNGSDGRLASNVPVPPRPPPISSKTPPPIITVDQSSSSDITKGNSSTTNEKDHIESSEGHFLLEEDYSVEIPSKDLLGSDSNKKLLVRRKSLAVVDKLLSKSSSSVPSPFQDADLSASANPNNPRSSIQIPNQLFSGTGAKIRYSSAFFAEFENFSSSSLLKADPLSYLYSIPDDDIRIHLEPREDVVAVANEDKQVLAKLGGPTNAGIAEYQANPSWLGEAYKMFTHSMYRVALWNYGEFGGTNNRPSQEASKSPPGAYLYRIIPKSTSESASSKDQEKTSNESTSNVATRKAKIPTSPAVNPPPISSIPNLSVPPSSSTTLPPKTSPRVVAPPTSTDSQASGDSHSSDNSTQLPPPPSSTTQGKSGRRNKRVSMLLTGGLEAINTQIMVTPLNTSNLEKEQQLRHHTSKVHLFNHYNCLQKTLGVNEMPDFSRSHVPHPFEFVGFPQKIHIMIDCSTLSLPELPPDEPVFCSLAVHDVATRMKVSEDFSFEMTSKEGLLCLDRSMAMSNGAVSISPPTFGSSNSASSKGGSSGASTMQQQAQHRHSHHQEANPANMNTKCLVSITGDFHSNYYLILKIYRLLLTDDVHKQVFANSSSKHSSSSSSTGGMINNIASGTLSSFFRIPYCWGSALFGSGSHSSLPQSVSNFLPFKVAETHEAMYDLILNEKEMKRLKIIQGSLGLQCSKVNLHENADVQSKLLNPMLDPYFKTKKEKKSSRSKEKQKTKKKEATGFDVASLDVQPSNGRSSVIKALQELGPQNRDFLINYSNMMYIMPKRFTLKGSSTKDIQIEIRFKDSDHSPNHSDAGLDVWFGSSFSAKFQNVVVSNVSRSDKHVTFNDEFKLKLPYVLTPLHHLLFTFYEVDSKRMKRTLVGYSVLQILNSDFQLAFGFSGNNGTFASPTGSSIVSNNPSSTNLAVSPSSQSSSSTTSSVLGTVLSVGGLFGTGSSSSSAASSFSTSSMHLGDNTLALVVYPELGNGYMMTLQQQQQQQLASLLASQQQFYASNNNNNNNQGQDNNNNNNSNKRDSTAPSSPHESHSASAVHAGGTFSMEPKAKRSFVVQANLVSSLYTFNPVLSKFFFTYKRYPKKGDAMYDALLESITQLPNVDNATIFRHFPLIFNMLISIICYSVPSNDTSSSSGQSSGNNSSGSAGNNQSPPPNSAYDTFMGREAFVALLDLITKVNATTPVKFSIYLRAYLSYMFDNSFFIQEAMSSQEASKTSGFKYKRALPFEAIVHQINSLNSTGNNYFSGFEHNWFLLGMIIKSMCLYLNDKSQLMQSKDHPKSSISRKDRFSTSFVSSLQSMLVSLLSEKNMRAGNDYTQGTALFMKDLFGIIDRGALLTILNDYLIMTRKGKSGLVLETYKFLFLKILGNYEHMIPLNLPLPPSGKEITSKEDLTEYLSKLRERHPITGQVVLEVCSHLIDSANAMTLNGSISSTQAIAAMESMMNEQKSGASPGVGGGGGGGASTPSHLLIRAGTILGSIPAPQMLLELRNQSIIVLRHYLSKHELDSRHQNPKAQQRIASMYFNFIIRLSADPQILSEMNKSEKEEWMICFLYIARNVKRRLLLRWFVLENQKIQVNFLTCLDQLLNAFDKLSLSRQADMLVIDMMCSILTEMGGEWNSFASGSSTSNTGSSSNAGSSSSSNAGSSSSGGSEISAQTNPVVKRMVMLIQNLVSKMTLGLSSGGSAGQGNQGSSTKSSSGGSNSNSLMIRSVSTNNRPINLAPISGNKPAPFVAQESAHGGLMASQDEASVSFMLVPMQLLLEKCPMALFSNSSTPGELYTQMVYDFLSQANHLHSPNARSFGASMLYVLLKQTGNILAMNMKNPPSSSNSNPSSSVSSSSSSPSNPSTPPSSSNSKIPSKSPSLSNHQSSNTTSPSSSLQLSSSHGELSNDWKRIKTEFAVAASKLIGTSTSSSTKRIFTPLLASLAAVKKHASDHLKSDSNPGLSPKPSNPSNSSSSSSSPNINSNDGGGGGDPTLKSSRTGLNLNPWDASLPNSPWLVLNLELVLNHVINLLEDSLKLEVNVKDPEMMQELYISIERGFLGSPELRVTWLENLAQLHQSNEDFEEAAECRVQIASLVAQYLKMREAANVGPMARCLDPQWHFFPHLAPNLKNMTHESALFEASSISSESSTWHPRSMIDHLKQAYHMFDKATRYELALQTITEIRSFQRMEKKWGDYMSMMSEEKELCERLVDVNKPVERSFPVYFRVAFYGSKWEHLDGKQFIYKKTQRFNLANFKKQIEDQYRATLASQQKAALAQQQQQDGSSASSSSNPSGSSISLLAVPSPAPSGLHSARHPSPPSSSIVMTTSTRDRSSTQISSFADIQAQGEGNNNTGSLITSLVYDPTNQTGPPPDLVILSSNDSLDRSTLDPNKSYVQMTGVVPYFDAEEAESRVSKVDQHFNVKQFLFETPFSEDTGATKETDDLSKQCKKKTIFITTHSFPYLKTRLEIVETKEIVLKPIENAIELIKLQVAKLRAELETFPTRIKSLQQVIQGSVVPMVNPGPLKICQLFLSKEAVLSKKYSPKDLRQLCTAMLLFVKLCGFAIKLNKSYVDESQAKFQKMVETFYVDLDQTVKGATSQVDQVLTQERL